MTITVSEHGHDLENGERVLDGFMETHPETGPSVSQNTREGTLSVTFGVDSDDAKEAIDRARRIFADGATASGLKPSQVVNFEASLVAAEEPEPVEAREPVPA